MYDLFNPAPDNINAVADNPANSNLNDITLVKGLHYVPNFLSKMEQQSIINDINAETWLTDIKRRVQHYGYKYNYKARNLDHSMFLGPLPSWIQSIGNRLHKEGFFESIPDQVIINEYIPGQGIANHVDCEPCFGETIISISLGSYCVMDFINVYNKEKVEVLLEPGSLVAISGEARHIWTHGIPQRKIDVYHGIRYSRKIRLSMTFRKVTLK